MWKIAIFAIGGLILIALNGVLPKWAMVPSLIGLFALTGVGNAGWDDMDEEPSPFQRGARTLVLGAMAMVALGAGVIGLALKGSGSLGGVLVFGIPVGIGALLLMGLMWLSDR